MQLSGLCNQYWPLRTECECEVEAQANQTNGAACGEVVIWSDLVCQRINITSRWSADNKPGRWVLDGTASLPVVVGIWISVLCIYHSRVKPPPTAGRLLASTGSYRYYSVP